MSQTFTVGALRFQTDSRIITREGAPPIRLSYSEHAIFQSLCTTGFYSSDRRIDQVIYRLRQKLGLDAAIMIDGIKRYRLLNATPADHKKD